MHDYLLSMVNDHIDEKIKDDLTDFILKTHNRTSFTPLPVKMVNTYLKENQNAALQKNEHAFSPIKINVLTEENSHSPLRSPSAKRFTAAEPLSRNDFEALIMNSFRGRAGEARLTYPYPSGGGLYTGQVIIYIKNVEGYDEGSYHYLPVSNQFEKLHALSPSLVNASLLTRDDGHYEKYDFFILYGSLLDKHICKYGYRGYRLAILEIGSMYRNLEFESQNRHLRSIVWGGFQDEALTVALGIDPRVVVPVICQIVGRE